MSLNPTVRDFLSKDTDKTLLSLAWSLWWRLLVVIYGSMFLLAFTIAILDAL